MMSAPPGKPCRVLFQDEGRFGRISDTRRCWAPLPIRPHVPRQVVREYIYGYVAVSPLDGKCSSLILPWSDGEMMSMFLAHTAQVFPGDYCLMFLDQAGYHAGSTLRVPENIRLLPIPPYSPELNPTEHVWEHLRENFFGNDALPSLNVVADRLSAGLLDLSQKPDLLRSLTCFKWIETLCLT